MPAGGMLVSQSGLNESDEQGMSPIRLGEEFGMVLHGEKERVIGQFNDLGEATIGTGTGDFQSCPGELLAIERVKFVPMPMPFTYLRG